MCPGYGVAGPGDSGEISLPVLWSALIAHYTRGGVESVAGEAFAGVICDEVILIRIRIMGGVHYIAECSGRHIRFVTDRAISRHSVHDSADIRMTSEACEARVEPVVGAVGLTVAVDASVGVCVLYRDA